MTVSPDSLSPDGDTHQNENDGFADVGVRASHTGACGPDQVIDADSLWACRRDQPVRLRIGHSDDLSAIPPVSIVTAFRRTVKFHGNRPALASKVSGSWRFTNFQDYYSDVWSAAKAFIKLGLQPFHGVGIIGFNSQEWFVSNLGAIFAGGLSTGIYTTNSPEACQYVANNARCNVIVVENENQLRKIRQVWDQLPDLKAVVQYSGKPSADISGSLRPVLSWSEFMQLSESVSDSVLEERISQQAVNNCCTLIYTSGTTGNPKGVMLSQDNLTWTAVSSFKSMGFSEPGETLVSYLPLSHIAAQILDMYIPMVLAHTVYFANQDALKGSLNATLRDVQPTVFMGVPRVWEKMHEKLIASSARLGYIQHFVLNWARSIGMRGNTSKMSGDPLPYGWTMANAVVLRKIRSSLGFGRCRICLSGAAPITRETMDYFRSIDVTILEVYGMSESSGPHTQASPTHSRIGSTGRVIEGVTLHFANPGKDGSGEVNRAYNSHQIICMAGRNVFMGYLDEEAKTREAIDDDGLLHSGDVGKVDDDGFLFITGRIKELLITAGGENVAPVPLEDNVKEALPCISNCMLVGDRRKFLSILLTLKSAVNRETGEPSDKLSSATVEWLRRCGCQATYNTVSDVIAACSSGCDVELLRKAIQSGVDRANMNAPSRAQTIQKWAILPRDFSVTGGELGPTLKLKRPVVLATYHAIISSMYSDS